MAGETQSTYHAVKELDADSKLKDEGTAPEQHSDRSANESAAEHFASAGTDPRVLGRGAAFVEKERDYSQQREAVIRPQQAGKIDFKSLHNRPKFASDRTWPGGKAGPQSPSGKSRGREKAKRSGKSERGNPQQLYRLSIANPRANPTIGIAYPQQKAPPPKKLEAGRAPPSGSYRFHVPSLPEREAELQQEELSYSRCYQEVSSGLPSPSFTSQVLGTAGGNSSHQQSPLGQQQQQQQQQQQPTGGPMENGSTQPGSQLLFPDYQLSGSAPWQSPDRTYNGANYGISTKTSAGLKEGNKASGNFVPLPFQYGYQLLEDSTSDPFPCDQNPQPRDFMDSSLGPPQGSHNSFSFQSCVEGQEGVQPPAQFSTEQQPPQYMQTPQGAVSSSVHCHRGVSEDSTSSEGPGSSSLPSEQGKGALSENPEAFGAADGGEAALALGSKRSSHPKDTAAHQRTLIQVHHARNIAQGPGSHMHPPSKTYSGPPINNMHMGSVPFDKSINSKVHSRLPSSWEGPNKAFPATDQSTIPYPNMNDKFPFQSQPNLEQRPNPSKSGRMPWQQARLASATPNQNRIELSRPLTNQKPAYMASPSDWQEDSKSHKNTALKSPGVFPNSGPGETFSGGGQEAVKHGGGTMSSFKVEMSHTQVCESKNKPAYCGLNQSLPGARSYGYQPLQVSPMGLMMVPPYESPSPSPVHNPNSSSTCSSLSPSSTSPVNLNGEDSQLSKTGPPPPFYQQQHQVKAQGPHHFHPDGPRSQAYAADRPKDNMMNYLPNNMNPKSSMEGNKGYMDSFRVEHHPPPPPYSAHQLLATSLANANLDQLDVLLTCKHCDDNFPNLVSFFSHKQFCGQHAFAQSEFKDVPKMEDGRKFHVEPLKAAAAPSSGSALCHSVSAPRCPSELHLSLLGLNKNGELMSDSETKGEHKDDPMKHGLFSGPGHLPVVLPDLDMEDAKLDSLITEALNGLGYQSDNAEIDSSFIDAFADDDLIKVTSNRQSLKTKESLVFESKSRQVAVDDRALTQGKYLYDSDTGSPENGRHAERKLEKVRLNVEQEEKINIKKVSHKNSRAASGEKHREQGNKVKEERKLFKSKDENTGTPRFLLSSRFSDRYGPKGFQDGLLAKGSASPQAPAVSHSSPAPARPVARESKRKRTGGGTWSKELIHKIVQQKNKLHKLHVKGTKNLQFSLVMERLTPAAQSPAFGEYDYVSDTDDEREPVKIASQGRLSQSSRCKYTYTKECKWRARSERDRAAWRHESKECFEVKKSEEVSLSPEKQRQRRRGSRSSTSSELSASVSFSSDGVGSPRSAGRGDSDGERQAEVRRRDPLEQRTYERSPKKPCQDSSTQLALTFTKSTKSKYSAEKSLNKDSSEAVRIRHTRLEEINVAAALPKARGGTKRLEKCRSTSILPREKAETASMETTSAPTISENNMPLGIDINTPKGASRQSVCNDTKLLPGETLAATSSKEMGSRNRSENVPEVKPGHKWSDAVGTQAPRTPALKLADTSTFEKHDGASYGAREETMSSAGDPGPKAASLCGALLDGVGMLSPTTGQDSLAEKDTAHLLPYPLDQDQGLMKSPLSFDTSSMFGDLSVAGFDNSLYTDMPLHKEAYNSLENPHDKKGEFVSSFSPFLEQRDWALMVDVSPMLPDEISQYKGLEKAGEKKSDYNHVPLSLPDKIMDYGANLNSCASEDELEIKRIVNELENQLQTTQLEGPRSPKPLQMSKFSPLRLGDEPDHEDNSLDMSRHVPTIDMAVAGLPPESFAAPTLPWSSPFEFELMEDHHSPGHGETGVLEHYAGKEHGEHNSVSPLSNAEQSELHQRGPGPVDSGDATDTTEEILEREIYTENLMKSLEVISDSIFQKDSILSEQEDLNVTSLESPEHVECQAAASAEREDHGEKEAIIQRENTLSPPNISERKKDIEFILNKSPSPLSNNTDLSLNGKQTISLQPRESIENNDSGLGEQGECNDEDIIEDRSSMETARRSNTGGEDVPAADETRQSDEAGDRHEATPGDNGGVPLTPEALPLTLDRHEEEEPVEGVTSQLESHPSLSGPSECHREEDEKEPGAIEEARENGTIDIQCGSEADSCCAPAGEQTEAKPDFLKEDAIFDADSKKPHKQLDHTDSQICGPTENFGVCEMTDLSIGAAEDDPGSLPLMETNVKHPGPTPPCETPQSTEGERPTLAPPHGDSLLASETYTAVAFGDEPEFDSKLECETTPKPAADIHNAGDIYEQIPVALVASPLTSTCGGRVDEVENREGASEAAPLTSSPTLLSPVPLTPATSPVTQHEPRQPPDVCGSDAAVDQAPTRNTKSLREESCGDPIPGEALHVSDPLALPAQMERSLVSPPQLNQGGTESMTPDSSPLASTGPAEALEKSGSPPKTDAEYDFKFSPLNGGETTRQNQFDYIPISPDDGAEEEEKDEEEAEKLVGLERFPDRESETSAPRGDPTQTVGEVEREPSLDEGHSAEQGLSEKALESSVILETFEFTCITLAFRPQSSGTDPSAENGKEALEICPNPLESIGYLNMHADPVQKVPPENPDVPVAPFKREATSLLGDASDCQLTPDPVLVGELEPATVTSASAGDRGQVAIEAGPLAPQLEEGAAAKETCAANAPQQGKAVCEICSMCFRTLPGLKRHKAMKHVVRADKNHVLESAVSSCQGSFQMRQASQSAEEGDKVDSQNCFRAEMDGTSDSLGLETNNSFLAAKAVDADIVREDTAKDTNKNLKTAPPPAKVKKANKARNKTRDSFSDELLNILKTDILQAIVPEFQNRAASEGSKSTSEEGEITNDRAHRVTTEPAELPASSAPIGAMGDVDTATARVLCDAVARDQDNAVAEGAPARSPEPPATGRKGARTAVGMDTRVSVDKDACEDNDEERRVDVLDARGRRCDRRAADEKPAAKASAETAAEIKSERNSLLAEEVGPVSPPASPPPPTPPSLSHVGLSAELKALLDDDTIFSQLFPRDEETKRKKCARVYGKRNKRPKLSPDSPQLPPDLPPSETLVDKKDPFAGLQAHDTCVTHKQSDRCEYETISLDDALMLNMCHNGAIKGDTAVVACDPKGDPSENAELLVADLLGPHSSTIDKSSIAWSSSSEPNPFGADTGLSPDANSCKAESPTTPLPGPLPALTSATSYPVEPCETDSAAPFHSINIQTASTTFQLPEIQFYDAGPNAGPAEPATADDDAEKRESAAPKKAPERRGRKRQDGSIRMKDKQYKCKACFTWFLTLGELNFHKLSHNPSPPPTCYMCVQRKFSSREQLRDHLREKHAKNKAGIWTCGMCLKEISDVWMYNEHLREHATQFARKPQSLGMSGSLMQETAVKNFITSIMQRRPSKASRESSKLASKEQAKAAADAARDEGRPADEPKASRSKSSCGGGGGGGGGGNGKPSALTPLEVLHSTETPKSVEMHPNCKDPSRDCHHCGKQFPKPFKLQRHLVVHNLEKIFLCHKCPVSYEEAQELKEHLRREHEEVDEPDSKHTTLYTCELCADVMHVIKKSFICSTCNYTFSKKEQFDRHMEKHLSGGNKIFKFRGVLRPLRSPASKEDTDCALPASKKRKVISESLQENSSDSGIASIASLHLNASADAQALKPAVATAEDSTQTSTAQCPAEARDASVKTEDVAEDYSHLLVELERCKFHLRPPESEAGQPTATPKTEEADHGPSAKTQAGEGEGKSIADPCDVKEEEHSPSLRDEATSQWSGPKEADEEEAAVVKARHSSPKSSPAEETEENKLENGEPTLLSQEVCARYGDDPAKHSPAANVTGQSKEGEQGQNSTRGCSHEGKPNDTVPPHGAEQQSSSSTSSSSSSSSQPKDKASPAKPSESSKHNSHASPRSNESALVHYSKQSAQGTGSSEEKDALRQQQQKKRKEMRSPHGLQRVSSPATRENFAVDARAKKKFRSSQSPPRHRKADGPSDYPVLASVRDDVVSNKIVFKHKTGTLGLPPKRGLLDNCTLKKEAAPYLNGDYKVKKGPHGRPLHSPVSKVSPASMNNALNKSKPKTGSRSNDSLPYRTAESQNHLLSQLFGQKLTSFKIPLRKDTSESIN